MSSALLVSSPHDGTLSFSARRRAGGASLRRWLQPGSGEARAAGRSGACISGTGAVDIATNKIKRIIHAGNDPEQLAISADGTRLYVANEDAATVSVVDVASGAVVASVKIGEEPEGVTIRPDGRVVYVTSEGDGAVFAIDTQTNTLLKRIPVGPRPRSIGFLPDGSRAYVSLEN